METTLNIAPKGIPATNYVPPQAQQTVHEIPKVKPVTASPTLPADKVFIAQVVAARLSGTVYPETPGEISPAERTLKPYSVPMLPSGEHVSEDTQRDIVPAIGTSGADSLSGEIKKDG